tara:strand:+ start:1874 stop:2845 length:972 start_codon:yes stop_codon:yes gene_type:complete
MENTDKNKYFCISCKKDYLKFKVTAENQETILDCSYCDISIPIKDGIPRFVPQDNYSDSFGYQWNIFIKTQLDSYTKLNVSRDRVYRITKFDEKTDLSDKNFLEAGSGAGRFTEILAKTNTNLYTFDYSSAINANKLNNNKYKNINFFQADVLDIPFEDCYFDFVFCLGVIQHTQHPYKTFQSLVRKLKPGGIIFIDVYSKKWHTFFWLKYILRPITKRISNDVLFKIVKILTPLFIPYTKFLKFFFGNISHRLSPIVEFSEYGISKKLNKEMAILDTFDMYSPEYDQPQTKSEVKRWFTKLGFTNISVDYGPNGIIGSAQKK